MTENTATRRPVHEYVNRRTSIGSPEFKIQQVVNKAVAAGISHVEDASPFPEAYGREYVRAVTLAEVVETITDGELTQEDVFAEVRCRVTERAEG